MPKNGESAFSQYVNPNGQRVSARDIAAALGGTGGPDEWQCKCPAHDDQNPSLSVTDGDNGKPVFYCHSGCTQDAVLDALRARKLWHNGATFTPPDPESVRKEQQRTDDAKRRKRDQASKLYYSCKPDIENTPAEAYLRRRGIWDARCDDFRFGEIPHTITNEKNVPALLVPRIDHETNELVGVQRIYLQPDGQKYAAGDAKLSLGAGGIAKLHTATGRLILTEGAETGMSASILFQRPAWVFCGGFPHEVLLPPEIRDVLIAADHDPAGTSQKKALVLRDSIRASGRTCVVRMPVTAKTDYNDVLLAGGDFRQGTDDVEVSSGGTVTADDGADWRDSAITGVKGGMLSIAANIYLALSRDPHWRGRITLDLMCSQVLLDGEPFTDDDTSAIQVWLQIAGLNHVNNGEVYRQVCSVARDNAFDPLKEYLESLQWHGTPRLDTWLVTYLGATVDKTASPEQQEKQRNYLRLAGRYWLIQAVARALNPGCKADYTLILEGDQGLLKSTACRILGGEWYSDCLPNDITVKDAKQHLRGKWILELSELGALSRSNVEHMKSFLTRQEEQYRPSYGRCEVHQKRRCAFIGTTNKPQYLRDESGGRRFWPISTTGIDLVALEADRDQLWAEAVHAYKKKPVYWPNIDEEKAYFLPEQEKRFESDAWEEAVVKHLNGLPSKKTTVSEILITALSFLPRDIKKEHQNRITKILHMNGWTLGKPSHGRRPWLAPKPETGAVKCGKVR